MKSIFLKSSLVLFLLYSSQIFGADLKSAISGLPSSVFVDADEYNSHADHTADLSGHVKVIRGIEQLTCDKAHVNLLTNTVIAEGNVTFISPKEFVRANKMTYDFKNSSGVIQSGFVQSGQETIEGEEIIKVGDKEFKAKNATYTTCINCPAGWKLSGSKIDATVGNYAFITSPVFHVYGIPVFWLPYLAIPIKSERQSGFLSPSFANSSTDGITFADSYFWAISKSRDMTITETSYGNRGFKTGVEYRFKADKNSSGRLTGAYLNDNEYAHDTHYTTPDCRYTTAGCTSPQNRVSNVPISRFALHYDHHYELPEKYVNDISINDVSDTNYPFDFPLEVPQGGDAALENRISLTKNSENTHVSADVDIYENLLKADPVGSNGDAVHRVPELRYRIIPYKFAGFRLGLDTDYVNFFRPSMAYDEANGISGFQPTLASTLGGYTDRFRTGQRAIVKPTLSYPFALGHFIDFVPAVAFEEDYYQFGYGAQATSQTPEIKPTASRQTIRTSIDARTRVNSIFSFSDKPLADKYKHELIPALNYTFVPYLNQDQHAFFLGQLANNKAFGGTFLQQFGQNQPITEFDNLQFDYRDRLENLNMATFSVTNVIIQKKSTKDKADYNQLIRHTLSQSYDFYTAYGPDTLPQGGQLTKQPWSPIHSLLEAHFFSFDLTSDLYYYTYDQAVGQATSIGLHDKYKDTISLGYAESYSPLIDQGTGLISDQVDKTTISRTVNLSVYDKTKYVDFAAVAGFDIVQKSFTSYMVYGLIRAPGKCWGISVNFGRVLGAAPNYVINPSFFFGEDPDTTMPRPAGV